MQHVISVHDKMNRGSKFDPNAKSSTDNHHLSAGNTHNSYSSTSTMNPLAVSSSAKKAATPAPAQGMIVVKGTVIEPQKDDCCCTIMSLHRITYDNPQINDIFSRLKDRIFDDMEEQKVINRLNAEYDLLHNIPRMPMVMGITEKEIMQLDLIPVEVMEFVSTVAEMIGNYFSDDSI